LKVFPVVTDSARWSSVFRAAPRPQHEGVDIFAPYGSPVVAVDDGLVREALEKRGGLVVYLKTSDGTQYYYAHLSEVVGDFPRAVKMGEVIGKVGDSGNAQGTPPHVHLEVRPKGGEKVDPAPMLDELMGQPAGVLPPPVHVPERPRPPMRKGGASGTNWGMVLILWMMWEAFGRKRGEA
jgi:murein DD-endopeptidase MepM/ murein hydrolase activator NlpD